MRTFLILSATIILFAFLVSEQNGNGILARPNRVPLAHISSSCLTEDELTNELKQLSFAESYSEQAKVVSLLMRDARKSSLCRARLVSVLIKAMDNQRVDLARDRASFYLWHYGSEMLADLKAAEALDFLIAHLELHDGTVFPLSHHPAMVAVVRMGQIAVPNLVAALRKSGDPNLRRHVVFCLGWVGGPAAQKALTHALSVETDGCTRSFIRATLAALNNKQQPNQITSAERLEWYAAFRCDGQ